MKIKKNNGFTLIELIIVIGILGIVATIALPNFNHYLHNANLKTAGRDLAGDIFNTKQAAAAQALYYEIRFNVGGNNYSIVQCGRNPGDPCNTTVATKSLESVASYIRIDALTYPGSKIGFQPRGTTAPSGSVTLKNDKESTILITTSIMGKVSVETTLK